MGNFVDIPNNPNNPNNNYWIHDKTIIFKPDFNSSVDDYIGIISKYNSLVFSNYNSIESVLKTNNIYDYQYKNNFIKSHFNQKIILPTTIINLNFGLPRK